MAPELPRLLADVRPTVAGNRITLQVDAQQSVALIDSAVRPARQKAMRTACVNYEKQIGLAFHNFHSRYRAFPPAFSRDNAGKPLLSWRVLILPFLEQQKLYDEFHLGEPWDSAHNQSLISKMPAIYRCPAERDDLASSGKTRYLAPRGPSTVVRGGEPVQLRDITDGTSNTLLLIDAGDENAVTWTKPDDWDIDPAPDTRGIFSTHLPIEGLTALFADGSVHLFPATIKPTTLRALLTRNGGEVIDASEY
jgi:hypothetical protein